MSAHKTRERGRHEADAELNDPMDNNEDTPIVHDLGSDEDEPTVGTSATSPELEGSPAELAGKLATLQAERDKLYEAWMRVTADFDNYRKRVDRERQEFKEFALENLMRQLVPVLDNFDRALDSLPPDAPKGFVEGVALIRKQLLDALARQGLSSMESAGQPFDPHLHEAVATEVRADVPHHHVLEEAVKGYRLGKRVLRPAMVKVSIRPDEESGQQSPASEEDLP
jgi:molecular chaperone GrpE